MKGKLLQYYSLINEHTLKMLKRFLKKNRNRYSWVLGGADDDEEIVVESRNSPNVVDNAFLDSDDVPSKSESSGLLNGKDLHSSYLYTDSTPHLPSESSVSFEADDDIDDDISYDIEENSFKFKDAMLKGLRSEDSPFYSTRVKVRYQDRNHFGIITQMYGSVWKYVFPYCVMNVLCCFTIDYLDDNNVSCVGC